MPFPNISDPTLPAGVLGEFENQNAQMEGWLRTEHTDDGGHGDVTATSLAVRGPVVAQGPVHSDSDVAADVNDPGVMATMTPGTKAVLGAPTGANAVNVGGGQSLNGLAIGGTAYGWALHVVRAATPGGATNAITELDLVSLENAPGGFNGRFARFFYNPLTSAYCLAALAPASLDLGEDANGKRINSVYASLVKAITANVTTLTATTANVTTANVATVNATTLNVANDLHIQNAGYGVQAPNGTRAIAIDNANVALNEQLKTGWSAGTTGGTTVAFPITNAPPSVGMGANPQTWLPITLAGGGTGYIPVW